MRRSIALAVSLSLLTLTLASCGGLRPPVTSSQTYEGAGVGGAAGAAAGALIDNNNRWRGALIGGALGAVIGGTVTEVSSRASLEAARHNQPVTYESTDGFYRVEAQPLGSTGLGCRQVQERIYQEGGLVREDIKEVC